MNESLPRRQIRAEEWPTVLRTLSSHPPALIHEGEIDEDAVARFFSPQESPAQVFLLPPSSRLFFFQDFHDQSTKDAALTASLFHLERFSPLAREKDLISMILEELLLNATVSAPRAAGDHGLTEVPTCRLRLEWDEESLWIHVSDPYGAFLRRNFEISFRSPEEIGRGHGHSGRGLKIIFERARDLWVRSSPGWGTVVSVRVALKRGASDRKTLLADFP